MQEYSIDLEKIINELEEEGWFVDRDFKTKNKEFLQELIDKAYARDRVTPDQLKKYFKKVDKK